MKLLDIARAALTESEAPTERSGPSETSPAGKAPKKPAGNRRRATRSVVLALALNPTLRYAVDTHTDIDPDDVIVTLAIRGKGVCEVLIPKSRYDAFALLELIERHTSRETVQ